jgi:hypothetical protein
VNATDATPHPSPEAEAAVDFPKLDEIGRLAALAVAADLRKRRPKPHSTSRAWARGTLN